MEKQTQTETNLSNEQLQEVTGDCADCLPNLALARNAIKSARGSLTAADRLTNEGDITGAKRFQSRTRTAMGTAQRAMEEIKARHPVPDLNQPAQSG
jgi:hypothetical protein